MRPPMTRQPPFIKHAHPPVGRQVGESAKHFPLFAKRAAEPEVAWFPAADVRIGRLFSWYLPDESGAEHIEQKVYDG